MVGMHFFNPADRMKLIEVIAGVNTPDETVEAIKKISVEIGKTPVQVNEAAGFVVNRILIPMINEAAFEDMGVKKTTFQELDKIAKPECIFASNTSSLSITEIGNGLTRPMVGMLSSCRRAVRISIIEVNWENSRILWPDSTAL